jgi:hypothetical protein
MAERASVSICAARAGSATAQAAVAKAKLKIPNFTGEPAPSAGYPAEREEFEDRCGL